MIRKLVPVLIALAGLGGGVGAGFALRPAAEPPKAEEPPPPPEYAKLNNQFVVPVLSEGRVSSMVILSLSLEIAPGQAATVYAAEPKLRDAFLRVLFDHANAGGFRGSFTDGSNLVLLRQALGESAMGVLGDTVRGVLITDIVRQDS